MYDIIGDIHGHAEKLIELLEKLGYSISPSGYCHPSRKVIFLGDFIDRGEHLKQHRLLMSVVMPMIESGHAFAVMGNHELNALAYHTNHNGEPLRPHSEKNTKQHQAFLNEYANDPEALEQVLIFFYSLPLWLDLGDVRIVHACWSECDIEQLRAVASDGKISPELLPQIAHPDGNLYHEAETILKGVEVELSHGVSFLDKDDTERREVRVQWWNNDALTLGEVALPSSLDIGRAGETLIPKNTPKYESDLPPCFIGHYWMSGIPAPLTHNVACLDYSVAKGGKLVAYRWSGEKYLKQSNFVSV